jgi:hypothetical protein
MRRQVSGGSRKFGWELLRKTQGRLFVGYDAAKKLDVLSETREKHTSEAKAPVIRMAFRRG